MFKSSSKQNLPNENFVERVKLQIQERKRINYDVNNLKNMILLINEELDKEETINPIYNFSFKCSYNFNDNTKPTKIFLTNITQYRKIYMANDTENKNSEYLYFVFDELVNMLHQNFADLNIDVNYHIVSSFDKILIIINITFIDLYKNKFGHFSQFTKNIEKF